MPAKAGMIEKQGFEIIEVRKQKTWSDKTVRISALNQDKVKNRFHVRSRVFFTQLKLH